jgi:hypothetical protein
MALAEENKQETPNSDEVRILYATADGWLADTDVNILTRLEQLDVVKGNPAILKAASDLIAKQEPGSWMRMPEATLVVLGNETIETRFGIPVD